MQKETIVAKQLTHQDQSSTQEILYQVFLTRIKQCGSTPPCCHSELFMFQKNIIFWLNCMHFYDKTNNIVTSEILTAAQMLMLVFWVVMLCGLVDKNKHFGGK
jgi:hypothetical protein